MIWLQCKSDDDDIMHRKFLSVKESAATPAQKLATNAFLFLYREQMSTQVVLSVGVEAYWAAQDTLRRCCTITRNWRASASRPRLASYGQRTLPHHHRGSPGLRHPRKTYVGAYASDQRFRTEPQLPGSAPGIAFYSAQEADPTPLRSGDDRSKYEEGTVFVWTRHEIRAVPGDGVELFMAATTLLKLSAVTVDRRYVDIAQRSVAQI
jgi:hypothetical protein